MVAFKTKTIEKIISNKINHWLNTITDENLRLNIKYSYIVTGGAIASLLQGELPNDYDLYFSDQNVCSDLVDYYLKDFNASGKVKKIESKINADGSVKVVIKSSGIITQENPDESYQYFELMNDSDVQEAMAAYLSKTMKEKKPYSVQMITDNAISLSDSIQIVTRFTGNPARIHENFDFVHCTNYYTEKTGLVLNMNALLSIMTKELKYVGSLYPICSVFRIRKFIERGWTITAGEILKMAWDISKLDLENINILKEQLIGVDTSYFLEMISLIKKEGRNLDRAYLVELIERVFDDATDNEITSKLLEENDQ